MLPNAFITLLTTPSYLPGALVLLHSLLELHPAPRDFKTVCLVTPETVDAKCIGELRKAGWDMVIGVEPIGSGIAGQQGLSLMGRPDLNFALTKLHLFRLHSLFSTLIYLDADVLPIRPLAHLFTTTNPHTLSACPDTGWPDCFNSGVMVIRPKESDWKGLRQLLQNGEGEEGIYLEDGQVRGNGSFDGADQGLLNEYFSEEGGGGEWNRLPFTYNVTPSAAYTYAPAYKRYGHKINVVHFIGPHKPWANIQGRPAGMSLQKKGSDSYDYPSLIDRWYEVYDRNVRPTAAHAPDQANRFAVPETVAVWNLGTGIPVQPQDRLNLEELKEAAGAGLSRLIPGQYISLPLDGRVDLIMPRPQPKPAKVERPPSPTVVGSPTQIVAPRPQTLQQQTTQPATWDASRYSPPKEGGPEMAVRMDAFYEPAWEQAPSQHRNYFSRPSQQQEQEYPTLPDSVTGDQWYKDYHGKVPDRKNIKAVFPWEQQGQQHRRPDRVFPQGEEPPTQQQSSQSLSAPGVAVQQPTPPAIERRPSPPPRSMSDAMASYTNAWDSMPSIQRYVSKITGRSNAPSGLGIRKDGTFDPAVLQSVPPTPRNEKNLHIRSPSMDRRSNASGDGDDEDEASSSNSEPDSPRVSMMMGWGNNGNVNYRDQRVQTEKPSLSDAKVQAMPGGGPSPAVRTFDLSPSNAPERRRTPRQSSSSDTTPKAGVPMTPPSDTTSTSLGRRGVPFPQGQQGSHRGAPQHGRRPSNGQSGSGHTAPEGGRRSSWSQYQQQQQHTEAKTKEGVPHHTGDAGNGRYFDPATDIDVRKRDTQEVLTRFMKVGSFSQSGAK